ncbi:MAG: DHH family phosphoesterase [Bacilli bacterium]|nr:DHH family phosphoesterase [Bacilli bacterium]
MVSLKARLLHHYELNEADLASFCLPPTLDSIPKIDDDLAVKMARDRIEEAIAHQEKILIYGDYDCDGVMATSILSYCFRKKSYPAATFIPSRYIDGYGLTMENAKRIATAGYSLVILVDNGVSCLEPISFFLSKGIQTIIIDHHELPSSLPPSYALIHPDTLRYGSYPVSAGYLSFLFSMVLLKKADPYLLILGALSTVSDLMPIRSHNREILRLALDALNHGHFPTIEALTETTLFDEDVLGMEIIPQINAVGRMVEDHGVNQLVRYFADPENPKGPQIASLMRSVNEERKALSKAAFEMVQVEEGQPGIFVLGTLKEGLNGLLANRLLQQYNKPVIVLSPSSSDPSAYVGSLRCRQGFDFPSFASFASSLLLRSGGHGFAGGFSLKKEKLAQFEAKFQEYAALHPLQEEGEEDIPLSLSEVTFASYELIRSFGPFGFGWKAPRFVIAHLPTDSFQYTRDESHLSTPLGYGVRLLGFHQSKANILPLGRANLHGRFHLRLWQGKEQLEFRIDKID